MKQALLITCPAPDDETPKAYKVWNGKSYSYLAKSQMKNVRIAHGTMTFFADEWFVGIHPWLNLL